MHPKVHAEAQGDKPAVIMAANDEHISYAQLDRRSNRAAQYFRSIGLNTGDTIAICMENHAHYFDIVWGAQRSGLVYVAVSNRLTAPEIAYILKDSGAQLLVSSAVMASQLAELERIAPGISQLVYGGENPGGAEQVLAAMPDGPIADERAGTDMLYSSGTTGRPKGVRLPLPENGDIAATNALIMLAQGVFGFNADSIYLSPAPLYHAAPLRWCMAVHKLGGTVIIMDKFDPERALQLIEKYQVNTSQWVPTHFVRMLKLPEETRVKYDVSSLKSAVHAAAPCPVPVKEAMIDWWGPVLMEYYAGTEGNGFTFISSPDWLEHKGSVGRALLGTIRICDDNGDEVPPRTEGAVYFEGGPQFTYHNDPEKTAKAANKHGWTSLGDVGWQDAEAFLYLTDRKSFMIISGGVNIYPQEIENLLVTHPKVADAAVIGAPDADLGEKVVAVIQPLDPETVGEELRGELDAFMRETLSGVKLPKQIDFRDELPRHATGKLYKRLLRDEYWGKADSSIV
ncbi:acyl-CoA synthetase [Sphingorhabdus sp. Alg239-R122]|uniref:acyl-CoA synthetase n=1 Tax=Sphingorhabdus sp. Alg239-R122 TaxID=2305989 RepID=UPI0013DB122A|nr:acyl-CoA synthetase [Sphingorhabdus sp. Alg239-R122]